MDMSLIAGMPEVIAYIRAQDERIKALTEELSGFKSVCEEYLEDEDSPWTELSSWCEDKTDEICDLKDQIDENEEENEALKEEYFDKGWEQGKCDTWDEIEKATEALKEENESLKHQVEKHKEAYSLMCAEKTRRYNELMDEKNKLEKKELYDAMDAKNSL
jgi:chromosome segregation ATPase